MRTTRAQNILEVMVDGKPRTAREITVTLFPERPELWPSTSDGVRVDALRLVKAGLLEKRLRGRNKQIVFARATPNE